MLNDTSLPELFSEEFDETRALWHKNKQTALSRALDLGPLSLPNDKTSIVNNDGVACLKIPSSARVESLGFEFLEINEADWMNDKQKVLDSILSFVARTAQPNS